jgi:hypothetical protein
MGSIRDITQCPRCGYKVAEEVYRPGSWQRSIFCVRCGYSSKRFFNSDKEETLKKGFSGTDEELRTACWDWKVIYPTGSYICRCKDEDGYTVDSIKDGSIEKLLEHLDEYDVCKHTFYKARVWYIKDLHGNTTVPFSENEYH